MAMSKVYLSGVKDILMCAICLEDMKEPRMLVCHHSFCTSCLKSIELTGSGFQRKLQCPNCRKYTNLPRGGVSYLPMDCKLNELSEIHRQAARVELSPSVEPKKSLILDPIRCVVCAQPPIRDIMVSFYYYYCNNCHDYLCNTCSDQHKDISVFKDHELISLAAKGVEPQRLVCLDHAMKYKDYHCEECEQLVCSVCVASSHSKHTIRPFEQHDKTCRERIQAKDRELFRTFYVPVCFPGLHIGGDFKPFLACLDIMKEKTAKKISDAAMTMTKDIERQRDQLMDLVRKQHSTIHSIFKAENLQKRCNRLWGSDEHGKLLKEYKGLLEEINLFMNETDDGEEIPELTSDSQLYADFCPEILGKSLGSLTIKTIKEIVSENKLAN